MTDAVTISRAVARRFLAIRHFLAPPRSLPAEPASAMTVIGRLGSLQFDPLEVAGRNHDLVLLARIDGYERAWTDDLLYKERLLFEAYNKGLSILPAAELPFHRISWDRSRVRHETEAFTEHAPLVEELLERIRTNGPLTAGEVGPRAAIDWYWRPTNQVRAILEALAEAGILGLARRDGNRRVYDLAERLYPEALLAERQAPRDQFRHKLLSRYRGHGLLGTTGSAELWLGTSPGIRWSLGLEGGVSFGAVGRHELLSELIEAGDLLPVEVAGIRGRRYIVASELSILTAAEAEIGRGAATTSTMSGRSTSRPPSDDGATTSCRSSTATGWSAGSSRGSIAGRTRSGSSGCGGRTASIRWPTNGSCRPWRGPSRPTGGSAASGGSRSPGPPPYGRSRPPSVSDWPSRPADRRGRLLPARPARDACGTIDPDQTTASGGHAWKREKPTRHGAATCCPVAER